MSESQFQNRFGARAPSNIALIKYMGKKEGSANLPENGSLSMTLQDLCTFAEVSLERDSAVLRWVPELPRLKAVGEFAQARGVEPFVPTLKDEGINKVLRHLERVRAECDSIFQEFQLSQRPGAFGLTLRTANTFPQGSGIASSASSFAAITLAATLACAADPVEFAEIYGRDKGFRRRLARLSRAGSGSSCRSFEGPWVCWQGESTEAVHSPLTELSHFVLVASEREKSVSSSQAHARIKSSPLWNGRVERVERRLKQIRTALENGEWSQIARIAWGESWEMHSLFHTSAEPFTYWEPETIEALRFLAAFIPSEYPPMVTLDAGPNVHVIVESRFADAWRIRLKERFPKMRLLEDQPGQGATAWLEETP